ncbi:MAG: flagellar assembly peptidoglycan hydrolase FlgJ, partial [Thioalkalispiraceae bacterium]
DPETTLRQVAKHFESLYLNMMLKSMRQASLGDPIFDSNNSALYRDLYDKQVALQMSEQNGIGIADMLVKQLSGNMGQSVSENKQDKAITKQALSSTGTGDFNNATGNIINQTQTHSDPDEFSSHHKFVETLMPYAEKAASQLDVAPQVLIAQAALETGWGQYVQKQVDGKSSHNLFNIKASSDWDGDSLRVNTLEYRDGVAQKESASFRVYSSYEESFQDYVDFIKNNPRYQQAREASLDPEAYAKELQNAGYATDPNYADKVIDIYQREIVAAPYSEYLMES